MSVREVRAAYKMSAFGICSVDALSAYRTALVDLLWKECRQSAVPEHW